MAYYNWRTTGDPLKMVYESHREQYEVAPLFVFERPQYDRTYNHTAIRNYQYSEVMKGYRHKRDGLGFTLEHIALPLQFFWGPVLYLAAVFSLLRPWDRWAWFSAGGVLLSLLSHSFVSSSDILRPHYLAPFAPLFVYLAVAGLRRMRILRWSGRRFGRPLAEAIVAFCLFSFALAAVPRVLRGRATLTNVTIYRPQFIKQLEAQGGKHLIVVRYGPVQTQEWVYNGADIDSAPIVWARDMGYKNDRLLDYYKDRTVWLLWAEENPPRLEPYR
jgi:hypothetical protein